MSGPGRTSPLGINIHARAPVYSHARSIASRIVHSRAYFMIYLLLTGLSTVTLLLGLLSTSCSPVFIYLEALVNLSLMVEVGLRYAAFGPKLFFSARLNWLDTGLTIVCALTLVLLLVHGCEDQGVETERLLDSALLVLRNTAQVSRLANLILKSGHSLWAKDIPPIDLSQAADLVFAVDIDLDQPSDYTRL